MSGLQLKLLMQVLMLTPPELSRISKLEETPLPAKSERSVLRWLSGENNVPAEFETFILKMLKWHQKEYRSAQQRKKLISYPSLDVWNLHSGKPAWAYRPYESAIAYAYSRNTEKLVTVIQA